MSSNPFCIAGAAAVFAAAILFPGRAARAADAPAEAAKPVAAALQPFVDSHTLAGAVVIVANKEAILDQESVGYEDVEAKKFMRPEDLFWIASMSKGMTAAALMMLVDEGKVKVDDPVEKYLPEFGGQMVIAEQDKDRLVLKHASHAITVKEVLSHTAGLPFGSRIEHHIDQYPLREAVLSYALSPLKHEPGTKYEYSNAGINTAGRIVEVVSGMPYEQFMQTRLFDPLGMKDTTFWLSAEQMQRMAKSYGPNAEKNGLREINVSQLTYPLTDRAHRFPCPAGGLYSTAVDVTHFCQMVLSGGTFAGKRLLSERAVQQMTSTQTGTISDPNGEHGYGFGWSTHRKVQGPPMPGSGGTFGHGGAYSTDMSIDPQHNLITVYMVQHGGYGTADGGKIGGALHNAVNAAFAK